MCVSPRDRSDHCRELAVVKVVDIVEEDKLGQYKIELGSKQNLKPLSGLPYESRKKANILI